MSTRMLLKFSVFGLECEAYLHTKWHLDASSRLATINMGRKFLGGSAPFWGRGADSSSNTKSPGARHSSIPSEMLIHAAIWPQQILAENWGEAVPFWGGELGLHLTQCGQGRCLLACQVSS